MVHLGTLAMDLRQRAGILRRDLGDQTGLGEALIKNFETGRRLIDADQLQKLLSHRVMASLPAIARAFDIDLPPSPVPEEDKGGPSSGGKT